MSPPLDEHQLAELAVGVGSEALLNELLESYRKELPAQLAAVHDARDAESLRKAAHALRSAAAMLGAVELAAAARELERSGDPVALRRVTAVAAETDAALLARRP